MECKCIQFSVAIFDVHVCSYYIWTLVTANKGCSVNPFHKQHMHDVHNRVVAYDIALHKNYSVCVVYTHVNNGTLPSILRSRRSVQKAERCPLSS